MASKAEQRKAFRQASIKALLETQGDRAPKFVKAAAESVVVLTEMFPGLAAEDLAQIAEAIGQAFAQTLQVPAYALSDMLEYTAGAYMVAGAALGGAFELPEQPAEPEPEADEGCSGDCASCTAVKSIASVDLPSMSAEQQDDKWPGMYL